MQCGKELPDDANFCLKCGKPIGSTAKPTPEPEPKWEYCEIVYQQRVDKHWYGDSYFIQLWAKGVGPNGTFNAGEVEEIQGYWPDSGESRHQELANRLVKLLTSKGWEPLPNKGTEWYSYKFRRKVSPSSSLPPIQKVEMSPKTSFDWLSKGNALFDLKRYEEALTAYDQALRLDPNNALAYTRKGNALGDLKRSEEALAAHEQALRLNPNSALAYNNKGMTLLNLKRFEEALAAYDQALRLDPNDALAYYGKGLALRNLKRSEEAQAAFDQAKRLDPDFS